MPLRVKVANLNRKRGIGLSGVKKAAILVLKSFGIPRAEIGITFVTDRKIKALNKKYLKRDCPTDVISFLLDGGRASKNKTLIGDIYISSDRAFGNALRFGLSLRKELLLYTIHGALHLVGFDDKGRRARARMQRLEKKFLESV
ncbi:MAG: rRNA maturation RNase YbeY [Omnitrophica bacterium]|nr:rRNA maturation RNase YbeY [Candidatus Omnitrophota bacterium]